MTGVWIALAYAAGILSWHRFGHWVAKRLGRDEKQTAAVMRSLSTDGLVKLNEKAVAEIARRKSVLS